MSRVAPLVVGCVVALALLASDASAGQLPVDLRASGSFAVLAGTTVTNSGLSTLNGDLGVSPGSALTGFPPGKVTGKTHAADPVAGQAQTDLTTAYNDAAGRTPPNALPADVGGRTLAPGVYKSGVALGLTGTLTLDAQGDPNAVFVFQVGSKLTTAVGSRVNLIGGAQAGNVFWQIGSSATLGTSSVFAGTILAYTSISMKDGVTLNGRALARRGGVTLINDTINAASPAKGFQDRTIHYAALGDSYSSGEGLGEKGRCPHRVKRKRSYGPCYPHGRYMDSAPGELGNGDHYACHRHHLAYPVLFTNYEDHPVNLDLFAACTGAKTNHIHPDRQHSENAAQADSIQLLPESVPTPDLVSLTIGGNDLGKPESAGNSGLGKLLYDCYIKPNCEESFRTVIPKRLAALPAKLHGAYSQIRHFAPKAVIVVLGYPRPFPTDTNPNRRRREENCAKQGRLFYDYSPAEQAFMNDGVDKVNGKIKSVVDRMRSGRRGRAGDKRIYFDDAISGKFTGHTHCDMNTDSHGRKLEQWTNGITGLKSLGQPLPDPNGRRGSFHPTTDGQKAYGRLMYGYLCGVIHFRGIQRCSHGGRPNSR